MSSYSQISTIVSGLDNSITAVPEYTSSVLAAQYRDYLNAIITIFNSTSDSTITQAQADDMLDKVKKLLALAKDGSTVNGQTSYITLPMANDLSLLVQSLQAVGITVDNGTVTGSLAQVQLWKALAAQSSSIQSLMQSIVVSADTGGNSLQALVELVYVRQGNEILGNGLDSLQTALGITKDSLDILSQLQNLHNNIQIIAKSSFSAAYKSLLAQVPTTDKKDKGELRDAFGKNAQQVISAFFNPPIVPNAGLGTSTNITAAFASVQKTLVALRTSLSSQLALLKAQTSAAVLADSVKLAASPYGQLLIVYNDLKDTLSYKSGNIVVYISAFTPKEKAFAGIQEWMLDNYDSYATQDSSNAGLYQQHIVNASTALSSLNTTQTEQVRNYLFVFEEFYKSASAVLQALTQIIQKMASNINK